MRPEHPSDPPLRFVSRGAGRFAYTDEGEGPALLAVHGIPGAHRDFRWLAAALAGRLRLIRLDMPGFGDSPLGAAPTDMRALAELVRAFAKQVIAGPYAVLGHSFGAPIATQVAAHDPSVTGLGFLAPVGLRPHRMLRRVPGLRGIDAVGRVPVLRTPVLEVSRRVMIASGFPRSTTRDEVARTVALLSNFDFAVHQTAIAQVRAPCFAAWAEDDAFVEPAVVEELLARAPEGPRLCFAEGGHNLQKTQAVEIADALVAWLS